MTGLVFYLERTKGFYAAYNEMAAGVAVYFVLALAYQFWISKVEKNAKYLGQHPSTGSRIAIITSSPKATSEYNVTVYISDKSDKVVETQELKGNFTDWFNVNGFIVYDKFATAIASVVPTVPKKDL
ncbi:hypothetical protein AWJ20_263 [Sugiyamaella lignohabitans]|uniref:Signal peptidase complex subunit 2 n=1 Tax=Sugiyamaella lignohabitans TaxID=796027 RepID=A0A167CRP6_9ASCO|nr:uncharacterized protein AWJ20_263 [Sugiyamaella lignohabitans]ANB12030.1 hypothetical protein AWJ20_263 [Sugiyamaella lignohabitans]